MTRSPISSNKSTSWGPVMPKWFVSFSKGLESGSEPCGSEQAANRKANELKKAGWQAFAYSEPTPDDMRSANSSDEKTAEDAD